jgi:hypothetical protein
MEVGGPARPVADSGNGGSWLGVCIGTSSGCLVRPANARALRFIRGIAAIPSSMTDFQPAVHRGRDETAVLTFISHGRSVEGWPKPW